MTLKSQDDLAFRPKFGRILCLKSERFDNRTILLCPKSKHIRISALYCMGICILWCLLNPDIYCTSEWSYDFGFESNAHQNGKLAISL